ncbi:ribonuclease H-like domain-containing protein, partial [Tanacetum coccineum]
DELTDAVLVFANKQDLPNAMRMMLRLLISLVFTPFDSATGTSKALVQPLERDFMRDWTGSPTNIANKVNYFLDISAKHTTFNIFLPQTKYATEILEHACMLKCNPCRTSRDTEKKLGPEESLVTNPTLYRSLAGALQYLTFTRIN